MADTAELPLPTPEDDGKDRPPSARSADTARGERDSQLGLRARITLGFTFASLLLSVLLGASTVSLTRRALLQDREGRTIVRASENATTLEAQLPNQPPDADLNPLLSDLRSQGPQFLMLKPTASNPSRDLQTFFTGDVDEADLPKSLVTRSVWDGTPSIMRIEAGGALYTAVAIPFTDATGAYVELNDIDDIAEAVRAQSIILMIAGSLTTLAGTALGWWASRRALRPLVLVGEAAGRIADGHLETRLDAADYAEDPELGPLVSSFNRMAAGLQGRIDRDARFASDVSHELRSPLTTINASVDVLGRAVEDLPERARTALDLLQSDLERFTQLVEDLLEISRFDAGAVRLEIDDVNLMALVRRAVRDKGDDIDVVAPEDLDALVVPLDKIRVVRVLDNFIDNAEKYGGGADAVHVDRKDDMITISVLDGGAGVPEEERGSIFERFHRGTQGGRRGAGTGVGLGLALVAEHARLMGGSVGVGDRPDGGSGACFFVQLPVDAPHDGRDADSMVP